MKVVLGLLLMALPFSSFAGEKISGVGLVLKQENFKTFVQGIVPNAPAQKDGTVQVGDELVAVDAMGGTDNWVTVAQMNLEDIVKMVRGKAGTSVGLHLNSPQHGQYEFMLTREEFEIPDHP